MSRPFQYFGSKQRVAPKIHALIPRQTKNWVETHCGSAIVTLSKPHRHTCEVINDRWGEIPHFFQVLRSGRAEELLRSIELTPYAEHELAQVYDAEPAEDPVERARMFLIRMWFGRGGDGHRTGFRWKKGGGDPSKQWAELPHSLALVKERLRRVTIRNAPALKVIQDYDGPGTTFFVDPPYPGSVGRRYMEKMTRDEHSALADRLRACQGNVILTMNPGTIYQERLFDWCRFDVPVQGQASAVKVEHILCNIDPEPVSKELFVDHGATG